MKTDKSNSYKYLQISHTLAICFGLPYTRREMKETYDHKKNQEDEAGQYRYSFDKRLIPVWTFYACLHTYVMYNNYILGMHYVGKSLKTCFEESYCFALIELLNRNIGPLSNILCSMFYGRRSKIAGLAGTERTLRFLDETRELAVASKDRLSRIFMIFSPVSLCVYLMISYFFISVVPPIILIVYWINAMGQVVIFMLVLIQYYVLERGFARVNDLVETIVDRGCINDVVEIVTDVNEVRQPTLTQLTEMYDELCTIVVHVNEAYAIELILQWPYTVIRIIMIVFRLLEFASSRDGPFTSATLYLAIEHLGEMFMFICHFSCMCTIGERLSKESKRILSSLEKLSLHKRFNTNMELKKATYIFYVRANARNISASIGSLIIFNMTLIKSVCSVIVTYILVLIQFRNEKGSSKPLYNNLNKN